MNPVPTSIARGLRALLALALALVSTAGAQGQPEVRARFDSGVVKLGSAVRLLVEVEGTRNAEILALPTVPGLRFGGVGSPSYSESYQILPGGRQSYQRTLTWTIAVQPLEKGEFTVPPFVVRADGRDLTTRELQLKVVEDLKGDELGLLEIDVPREVYQGQPFWMEIRFGFDAGLRERLNYYNLSLPWLGELAGLVELEAPPIATGASAGTILLNSRYKLDIEGLGTRKEGDTTFLVLRIKKRFVATRPGALSFPTSHFEFGQRSDGFAGLFGRPTNEFVYYKRSAPFEIAVRPLPEAGRPLDFSGAVGRFEAAALADRRDVVAGDSIKLTVEWTGAGNLEFFDPPDLARLDSFKGFRVYGTQDRKTFDRRTLVYDIAPIRPDVTEIPAVPLTTFDTGSGTYGTVSTRPIAIRVRPLEGATGIADEAPLSGTTLDIRDIQTRPEPAGAGRGVGDALLAGLWGGVAAGWLALRAWVRRREDPDAPRVRARRRARRELERALRRATTGAEQAAALQAFLAARTGEQPEAWAGRDPIAWLREHEEAQAELREEEAHALRRVFQKLDASVWGGRGGKVEDRELLSVADLITSGASR